MLDIRLRRMVTRNNLVERENWKYRKTSCAVGQNHRVVFELPECEQHPIVSLFGKHVENQFFEITSIAQRLKIAIFLQLFLVSISPEILLVFKSLQN